MVALLVGTACRIVKLKCIERAKDTNNKKYTMKMIYIYMIYACTHAIYVLNIKLTGDNDGMNQQR